MKELSKKIRFLRHQRGWSQEDVAKQLNISIPAFSKIETGITDVNISRLRELAKIFDLTLVNLLITEDLTQKEKHQSDVEILTAKLHEREMELINLQRKSIELYEELRNLKA